MTIANILFVDDEANVLRSYQRSLRRRRDVWNVKTESCPIEALNRLRNEAFDLVVSDVRMPGLTGIELLQAIKDDPVLHEIPVVIVTGEADKTLKRTALDFNAADLLNKPVDTEDLISRIASVLRVKQYADKLKYTNERLEEMVRERTAELEASRIDILWRLGKAAESRDEETGNHVIRVGAYSQVVARVMGFDEAFCNNLFLAAPLHDIGKIGISDSVLLKPGKLSDEQWREMRSHCTKGVAILTDQSKIVQWAAKSGTYRLDQEYSNPVILMAAEIARSHHEHWDGGGYPNGLAGNDIPLAARIVAIADVYDALRSKRPYKEPFSVERCLQILREGSGTHFDPDVVSAFLAGFDEIRTIENELNDQKPVDGDNERLKETSML